MLQATLKNNTYPRPQEIAEKIVEKLPRIKVRAVLGWPADYTRNQKIVVRVIISLCVLEAIGVVFIFNSWFSRNDAVLFAEATVMKTRIGTDTEELVGELEAQGLHPDISQKIYREPLTVEGVLVALSHDNIQVFEYSDRSAAEKEKEMFAQKMAQTLSPNVQKTAYMQVRDTMIIFYMGYDESIISMLERYGARPLSVAQSF